MKGHFGPPLVISVTPIPLGKARVNKSYGDSKKYFQVQPTIKTNALYSFFNRIRMPCFLAFLHIISTALAILLQYGETMVFIAIWYCVYMNINRNKIGELSRMRVICMHELAWRNIQNAILSITSSRGVFIGNLLYFFKMMQPSFPIILHAYSDYVIYLIKH